MNKKITKSLKRLLVGFFSLGILVGCSIPNQNQAIEQTEIIQKIEDKSKNETQALNLKADSSIEEDKINPKASESKETSSFSVHFIDVGQADAALIECDGHYMLIDGGNKADSNIIYTVLKNKNIQKLDIVVGTHAHEDHIGGIPGAFNFASADLTLCPTTSYNSEVFKDFARYANEKGGGITIPSVNDSYALGSATVHILGVNSASETNDTSIVLKIQYGETSFLFTGDAEREAEQVILDSGADLSSTVLKVAHHGSSSSTTYPFLREVMPQIAIISVGEGNSYGHPHKETLSKLKDADVQVYRSDLEGDIFVHSDGKKVTIETSKSSTKEPSSTNEAMVWILKSGKKYHSSSDCSNMKNPIQISISEAERLGFTPCEKCY